MQRGGTLDRVRRLFGLRRLVHHAIEKTTDLVEETQEREAARWVRPLTRLPEIGGTVERVDSVRRAGTSLVYASIRATNRGVRALGDAGERLARTTARGTTEAPTPLDSSAQGSAAWWADHVEGTLNGFVGDALHEDENPLALPMTLRHDGVVVPVEPAAIEATYGRGERLVVFVHGLSCTEWSWAFRAEELHGDPKTTFGTLLARDLGLTPLWVRYNTGRHVSDNGKELSALLDALVRAWPVPVESIALVGHSMGGLVSRSAVHVGRDAAWASKLRHVVAIGSPHLGAPLEKAGNVLSAVLRAFDTAGTQVPARVLDARSAGIKDLRFGYTIEDEWKDRDPDALLADHRKDVPFVDGVRYAFVATTLTKDPSHPVGRLLGDMLVREVSARGEASAPARRLPFHVGHVQGGIDHLTVQNHPDVYAKLREWLAGE